ncbi:MAG: putative chemotaxis CheB/CheR fusion protein [Verrucomicrobiaceae bacterium]|nr:putative chemotaxis CheB/CheR fusion protein [Verrucomicrobiaceae bacterium]
MTQENRSDPGPGFYVVGLGASAGGLEALRHFFEVIPERSGAAYVVIQHLAPDHPSQMVELLAMHTAVKVSLIEDGVQLAPNHVYVIPPGKCVKAVGGKLELDDAESRAPHLPIDHFLRSLGEDCRDLSVAIVLSGTGSDGTLGVKAIKEAGGMVMVQDSASSKFSGMPDSAAATGLADYTLPPAGMAAELLKFIQHPLTHHAPGAGLKVGEATMQKIFALVQDQTAIAFSEYKQSTVVRRIERRIGIAQLRSPEEYLELLQQSPLEVVALGRDLLISVTRFFRDAEVYEALSKEVLPLLLKQAEERKTLRMWVPGCATGEEAYSIAMLVQELITARGERWNVKIFATDVDGHSLESAGRGSYPKSIAADVPPELLARYFVEDAGAYRICTQIREQVVFARQNILRDPPFTKLDLISCRNLLIYLQPAAQQKVMTLFHFALRPGGALLLGTSETIGDREHAFDTVNAKMRLFRRRGDSTAAISEAVSGMPSAIGPLPGAHSPSSQEFFSPDKKRQEKIWDNLSARLMAEFGTTCLVLNSKHEIEHSFGEPQRFLAMQPGRASLSVIKLLPRPLALVLARALRQSAKEHRAIQCTSVRWSDEDATSIVDLKVEPLAAKAGEEDLILVFFQGARHAPAAEVHEFNPTNESVGRIADLEDDLEDTKQKLQSATEDKRTAHEELQATNEELLAGNEELQSSNEELESVNEELTTLNAEYQQKIAELTVANNDLENFLRTSDVATIFLDVSLRLRKFTPAVTREIPLQPHDVGRLLTDFAHPLIQAIATYLPVVASSGVALMKTFETTPGTWHLIRITPYRREGASDRGLVVTILDVSALRRAEGILGEGKPSTI